VERRQQLMPFRAHGMAAVSGMTVLDPIGAGPVRHRRPKERIHGRPLFGCRLGVEKSDVH
jgi:hypothetical protein